MAGYNGRKSGGVNVSQYIANLNKEPSAFEVAAQRSAEESEGFDIESELAQFTNAEFLDFDTGDHLYGNGDGLGFDEGGAKNEKKNQTTNNGLDFVNGEFPLPAVNPFEVHNLPQQPQQQSALYPDFAAAHPLPLPAYPGTTPAYPSARHQNPSEPAATTTSSASPADSTTFPSGSGDPARALAEEDKRRRNTAASARFRVKKKQREQALESKTQELEKHTRDLEQRIAQLAKENEWLRGLVVEKNGGAAERSTSGGKKGVGTGAGEGKEEEA